jgi:uncharacterized RDD family membrane protein YckC
MQWYYAIDGRRLGPVPHEEFERLVHAGTIGVDALVWRQGMDQWQTLADVKAAHPDLIADAPPPLPEFADATSGAGEPAYRRPMRLEAEEAEEKPGVPVYAGFGRRFGAYLVDFLIWWFVWQLLVGIVGTVYFPEAMAIAQHGAGYQPKPEELGMLLKFLGAVALIGMAWSVAYDALFILRFSATPGKLIFGLRIVQANNQPLGFGRIVGRCLAKGLVGFTLGIGYLVVAFDDQKRGLHDYLCNTRVIKNR